MSVYLNKIDANTYRVETSPKTSSITVSKNILETTLNFNLFYVPEKNVVFVSSDAVLNNYLKNQVPIDICQELIAKGINNVNFDNHIQNGLKSIEFAKKLRNALYLDHCMFVIANLYMVFVFGFSTDVKYDSKYGWKTSTNDIFMPITGINKYGAERFQWMKSNISSSMSQSRIFPFCLAHFYAKYVGEHSMNQMNYLDCEHIAKRASIRTFKQLIGNVVGDYYYNPRLYMPTGESFIDYYEEIAKVIVPRQSQCYVHPYSVYTPYNKAFKGTSYGYLEDWFVKEFNDCLRESDGEAFKRMTDNAFVENPGVRFINMTRGF